MSRGLSRRARGTACARFTPSNSGQRSDPTYYRGCWHVVCRSFFLGYRLGSSPRKGVYTPKGVLPHAASLRQACAHCGRFLAAASRRSGGRVSVPLRLAVLSDQLRITALVGRYPANQLIRRRPLPGWLAPFLTGPTGRRAYAELPPVSGGYPPPRGRLPTCSSPVRHVSRPKPTPSDLHALGAPPALILSQDQTLHQDHRTRRSGCSLCAAFRGSQAPKGQGPARSVFGTPHAPHQPPHPSGPFQDPPGPGSRHDYARTSFSRCCSGHRTTPIPRGGNQLRPGLFTPGLAVGSSLDALRHVGLLSEIAASQSPAASRSLPRSFAVRQTRPRVFRFGERHRHSSIASCRSPQVCPHVNRQCFPIQTSRPVGSATSTRARGGILVEPEGHVKA